MIEEIEKHFDLKQKIKEVLFDKEIKRLLSEGF